MEENENIIEKIEDKICELKNKLIDLEETYILEKKEFNNLTTKVDLLEFPDLNKDLVKYVSAELFSLLVKLEGEDEREFTYHHLIENNVLSLAIKLTRNV